MTLITNNLNNKQIDPDYGNAETFFSKVMAEYPSVTITWPPKLKAGTKSKKDPHVKISGIPFMVKAARIKILESLDPRRDRVTLKMDIDWTAHSHIIGKAGASIQKVMDKSGCHVHFPDANRTKTNEKSNQVSISGSAEGVREARVDIRELLPMIIWFNLILKVTNRSLFLERLNKVIKFIEKLTTTQITLRFNAITYQMPESTAVTIFFRGVYGKSNHISLGIDLLYNFMDDFFIKDETTYQMNTEISANHHNFIIGFEKSNLNSITRTTGALITFPENKENVANEVSTQQKKTTVNIKGSTVNSVLMAFHLLELHIPLSLTFDLKEGQEVDTETIEMISNKWGVLVSVRPKPKQNTKTIWIKAPEKDEWKLFEARKHIIHDNQIHLNTLPKVWSSDVIDPSIWSSNDTKGNDFSDSKTMVSISTESQIGFEKAPGAERYSKVF